MPTNRLDWNGDAVEKEVNREMMKQLDMAGLVGVADTKRTITKLGRIDTGQMRADIHHETDAKKLRVRWGGNVKHLLWQELGTLNKDGTQRIEPMFALRGSMMAVKRHFDRM